MNRFDLLVQIKIALVFLHLALDATTNAFVYIQNVHFTLELLKEVFKSWLDLRQIKDELLVLQLQGQMRRDRIGQASRVIDARNRGEDLRGNLLVEFHVLVKLLHDRSSKRFNFSL